MRTRTFCFLLNNNVRRLNNRKSAKMLNLSRRINGTIFGAQLKKFIWCDNS